MLRRSLFLAGLALVLANSALAIPAGAQAPTSRPAPLDQRRFPTGAIDPAPEQLAQIPFEQLTRAYIPEAIDLSARFPAPDQQAHSSCTAWATGYAARSYYARAETGSSLNSDDDIPSPAFIYNRTFARRPDRTCENSGSSIVDALNLLQSVGSLSLKEYGNDQTCVLTSPMLQSAPGKFRITGHGLIGGRFTTRPLSLDLVRQQLAQGHPVVIGMRVDAAVTALRPDAVYGGLRGLSLDQLRAMDGHAMVLVGYDDRRRAMRVLNSWGKTWSDGGFGWLSYEALQSQVTFAHVMRTSQAPPRPAPSRPPDIAAMPNFVKEVLEDAECALVELSMYENTVSGTGKDALPHFTGFVSRSVDKVRFDAVQAQGKGRSSVVLRPWPLCEASLHLRGPLRAPSRPTVTTLSGKTTLKVGETFGLRIKAPDIPMFLYAYYLEDDGTIVNLLPRRGPMRAMTPAGAEILLGDGQVGRPTFRVTALKMTTGRGSDERGHEAVIVIGARAPIEELEEAETAKPGNFSNDPSFREAAAFGTTAERLLLAKLKDLTSRREGDAMLQREAGADLLHLRITE